MRTGSSGSEVLGKLKINEMPDHAGIEIPIGCRFARNRYIYKNFIWILLIFYQPCFDKITLDMSISGSFIK